MGVLLTNNGRDSLNKKIQEIENAIREEGQVKGDAYRQGGEWHDNFAFEESSRREIALDRQRRELKEVLENATMVPSRPESIDNVTVGCVIELEDEDGVSTEYYVAGYGESDITASPKRLEHLAPVIRPFMDDEVGEEHEVQVGGKGTTLALVNIRRP